METLIDTITSGFLSALDTALLNILPYGLGLLSCVAVYAYCFRFMPQVMSSGAGLGDTLAAFLMLILSIGLTLYVTQNIRPMGDGLYEAAVTLGLRASGATVDAGNLRQPSFILSMHKDVTRPLETFILNHSGFAAIKNAPTIASFWLAEMGIYVIFVLISLQVALAVIEFYIALMAGALFIPCIVFSPSASIGEWVVGWVLGGTVRIFLTAVIVGIAIPLFESLIGVGGGGDPRWVEVLGLLGGAALFGILAWQIPRKASHIVGNGLGLDASSLGGYVGLASTGMRLATAGGQATSRVISPLLQRT